MIRLTLGTLSLALLLAACGQKAEQPASEDDERKARGEVLGGSISDAMIPLDQLESKSPPLKAEPTAAASEAAPETEDAPGEEPAPAEASEPAPADEPAED